MKIKYRDIKMGTANKERLQTINGIIEDYQAQGYLLTLRQLYYQLVSRDIIANHINEYKKLSVLLKEGRMAGVVDWGAIEDRLRDAEKPSSWSGPESILQSAVSSFALDHQDGQDTYIEVWVEKDALSGVLERVTQPYHVPIVVNRGYSSATAMHEAYKRFRDASEDGKNTVVLYLGDHDHSGVDMIRDIKDRIQEFADGADDIDFEIIPIALTRAQIKKYNPPPNPVKVKDSRAAGYKAEHGGTCWEVDALPPEVLNNLLEGEITKRMDMDKYNEVLDEEETQRKRLSDLKKYL